MSRLPLGLDPNRRDDARLREFLTVGLPKLKLALGARIDRANERPIPAPYAAALGTATLNVVLGAELATLVKPIVRQLEADLAESCRRHGLLYDRAYRVRLWDTADARAADFDIVSQVGDESPPPAPPRDDTADGPTFPTVDPDATVLGVSASEQSWSPSGWLLRVSRGADGEPTTYPVTEAQTTIGRQTDRADLTSTIMLDDAPRTLSRRQLALAWEPRERAPGFRLYNVGTLGVRADGKEVPGMGGSPPRLDLDAIDPRHTVWIGPDARIEIVGTPLVLWLEANESSWDDWDVTVVERR